MGHVVSNFVKGGKYDICDFFYIFHVLASLTLLEYKCRWHGVNLIKIDRFTPSSKTCGKCGYVYKGLKLSECS